MRVQRGVARLARGLIATALAGASLVATPAASQEACLEIPGINDKCAEWVAETEWGEICCDFVENPAARNIATTEHQVFLTLPVNDPGTTMFEERWDWDTVAFDASDGAEQWRMRHDGPAGGWDVPLSLMVSPDASVVYVTGYHDYPSNPNTINLTGCARDFGPASAMTIAYDATDGTEIWRLGGDEPSPALDAAFSSALSPDGSLLYTVGIVAGGEPEDCDFDIGIAAVDAGSGAQLWTTTLAGDAGDWDAALAAAVTPDGSTLLVGGVMTRATPDQDYVVAALDAVADPGDPDDVPGEILWEARHTGPGYVGFHPSLGALNSMALSPDGTTVFITGETALPGGSGIFGQTGYDTLAFDTATGEQRWRSLYTTLVRGHNLPLALAVSPQGDRVFVTGQVVGETEVSWDYGTVAYDAATGTQLWDETYRDPATQLEEGADVVVSPDGDRVYVTGHSGHVANQGDAATLAYDAADGSRMWVGRLNGSDPAATDFTQAIKMALSPAGDRLFAVGSTQDNVGNQMYDLDQGNDAARGLVWSYDTSG